jgi:hypothetical protein
MQSSFRHILIATTTLMGIATASAALAPAMAQDSATGARPGHIVGVGDSLPRSTHASNIGAADNRAVAPTLPGPNIGEGAAPRDYLLSAKASLANGHTGQAQQALEMAETRALDRSFADGQSGTPSDSPFVARIRDALHALGNGNRDQAIHLIDVALAT